VKKLIVLLALVFFATIYFRYYHGIPERPADVSEPVWKQAVKVTRGLESDKDKAYALYRYLAENVHYDVESLFNLKNSEYPDQGAEAVLERKNAVCAGYSNLYHAMAKAVGLESEVVTGLAHTTPDSPLPDRRHAWNAVKWDEEWHLIDCTWGAGSTNFETQEYNHRPNDDWFQLTPEQFSFSHLPEDPRYFFSAKPMDLEEFDSLPYFNPRYFLQGLKLREERKGYYQAAGRFELRLTNPGVGRVVARLRQKGKILPDQTCVLEDGDQLRVVVLLPRKGDYELLLFSQDGKTDNIYFGSVFIHSTKAMAGNLPDYRTKFFENGLSLEEPERGLLPVGEQAVIRLTRPSSEVGVTAHLVDSEGDVQKQMVLVNDKSDTEVEILARGPKVGRYKLDLFAAKGDSDGEFVASLNLQAKKPGRPFPLLYGDFYRKRCDLVMGTDGTLARGRHTSIVLKVPDEKAIYLRDGEERHREIKSSNGTFVANFSPKGKTVSIDTKKDNSYRGMFQYEVR